MWISDVSVRWTGHLFAMSSRRAHCSSLSAPLNSTSRSTWSSIPTFVSADSKVVGSSPTAGSKILKKISRFRLSRDGVR